MLLDIEYIPDHAGYFAGTGDGILTAAGRATIGNIYVFEAETLLLVAHTRSLQNGHYIVPYLDPGKTYLILARHPKRQYDPVGFDAVKPATNLTTKEQKELWQSWL